MWFAGGDIIFIDLGLVGALEIFNIELFVEDKDAAVIFGDVALREDDIITEHSANNEEIFREGEL